MEYNGLSQISDKYDTFLVDLWGVIHDGMVAYPGVNEALANLKDAGKKVIFISNAPRRASKAIEGLRRVGVPDGLYDNVITSGEVVFEFLRKNLELRTKNLEILSSKFQVLSSSYLIIGPERDAGLLDGTDYTRTMNIKDAGFMIVTGFDNDDSTIEEKQHYLDEAIKLNLLLICANPDLVVVRQTGQRALCAGVIAKKYEDMGGKVIQFGKPYMEIYNRAIELAGNPKKSRVAAIGDSLITDIKGANDFGIDSYFIPGGIYGEELGIKHGELPTSGKLLKLCDNYKITPTGVLPEFVF